MVEGRRGVEFSPNAEERQETSFPYLEQASSREESPNPAISEVRAPEVQAGQILPEIAVEPSKSSAETINQIPEVATTAELPDLQSRLEHDVFEK